MHSFDSILNGLSNPDKVMDTQLLFDIQAELGPALVALIALRFYDNDGEIGKSLRDVVTDCINNHLYYEVDQ